MQCTVFEAFEPSPFDRTRICTKIVNVIIQVYEVITLDSVLNWNTFSGVYDAYKYDILKLSV